LTAYPHIPRRLRKKSDAKKDIGNSMLTLDFFMLVFVVNRLLVLNFGQRDATSLFVLTATYPLLVSRSKTDCARLAEAFNRKSVAVVECFFTFVSSVFQVPFLSPSERRNWVQMIVFLSINSKANPLYVFFLINGVDLATVVVSGPLTAFFRKANVKILREHRSTVDFDPFNEALGTFAKWVKARTASPESLSL